MKSTEGEREGGKKKKHKRAECGFQDRLHLMRADWDHFPC